ncbi:Hyperpolarization-activated voltage-gated potassium channel [uncultured archaeon]|nr:Hyperpolarization-activated voltage-gated potassium channel [uncultured archaeon]
MSAQTNSKEMHKNAIRSKNLRQTVQFYMIDFQTPLGKAIDVFIIILNLLAVSLFIANTYDISSNMREALWKLELLVVGIFIIEYALRLYGAPNRWSHVRELYSIIDIIAIMPTVILLILPQSFFIYDIRFIQTIRVLAVLRIFRFLRFITKDHLFFGFISIEMVNVARLITTVIMLFFVDSGLFFFVESPVNPKVQNFGDAFYFTVIAISTVGFGDIVPVSPWGRLVTLAMIISGIIIIPVQVARIFRAWLNLGERKTVICPGCNLSNHDTDARYCRICGADLTDSPEQVE